jgi:high-affinity Fe2+/Pb2+ permease
MQNKSKTRWILQAVAGLLLTGSGLSMAIDAGITKLNGGDWFWYGTGSLLVFQAGLCLLIDSVRYKP